MNSLNEYSLPVFNTAKYRSAVVAESEKLQEKGFAVPVLDVETPQELQIIPAESEFHVRLAPVRADLKYSELDGISLLNYVKSSYYSWVKQTEYLVLMRIDGSDGPVEFVGVKASKRGNDVYAKRVAERFSSLYNLPDVQYFNYKDRSSGHTTGAIFCTNTYDPDKCTIGEAWERVGYDTNRFYSAVKKRYGDFRHIRVFEAQKNGYPHVHTIMLFPDACFNAFHHNGVWRVQEKHQLAEYWGHGFTDVEALCSTKGGIHYVAKYLGKLHELDMDPAVPNESEGNMSSLVSRASLTTLSLMWVYRKRSFSVSRKLNDLILLLHNSNAEFKPVLLQVDLMGSGGAERVPQWVLCGFFVGELVKGGRLRWSVELSSAEYRRVRVSGAYVDRLGVVNG